jgi:hypothetical protein
MDQHRLQAYLQFIEQLLTCPQGQEVGIFEQNQELLEPELIPVLEQAAQHLALEEDTQAALYLQGLATQLQGSFIQQGVLPQLEGEERARAYLKLIDALLCCPSGLESNILNTSPHLVDAGLVETMETVGQLMREEGELDSAEFVQGIAQQLRKTLNLGVSPSLKKIY